jgi:hypothetical protein
MKDIKTILILASTLIWLGFITASAVIEYWFEYKVSASVGFIIVKELYLPLNNAEWIFPLMIVWAFMFQKQKRLTLQFVLFLIPCFILAFQASQLLPLLQTDIASYLKNGRALPNDHFIFYLTIEILKVIFLSVFAIYSYRYWVLADANKKDILNYTPTI